MDDGKRKDLVPADGGAGTGEPKGKADAALEFAREKAELLLDDVKLRRQIFDAKARVEELHASIGRAVRAFLSGRGEAEPLLAPLVEGVDAVTGKIARLESDEREAAAEKPREVFLDRLKQAAARAAGIAKYKLQRSLLERDLAAAERALGECVALQRDQFAELIGASPEIAGGLASLKTAEERRAALEAALASLEGAALKRSKG